MEPEPLEQQLPGLSSTILESLEAGQAQMTLVLQAAQLPEVLLTLPAPYAITKASLTFDTEMQLHNCVKVLLWSGDTFKTRPNQLRLWSRDKVYREGMQLTFTVNWYQRNVFEKRKNAFMNDEHNKYYALFDANPSDLTVSHHILSNT